MDKFLRLSVHQLVDFLLRNGDIDNRIFNRSSMSEGSRIHSSYQSAQSSDYLSEYPLKHMFVSDDVSIMLEGRADGIIMKRDGGYIIDEIKSTIAPLKEFRDENIEWHLGQAKCYALMFALEKNIKEISVRLTYIRQGDEKEKMIENYSFLIGELNQYVKSLLEDYVDFYNIIFRYQEDRNVSVNALRFPFKYRKGQKELSKYTYAIATKGGRLFIEAPTGIGKTMSTLFPYIKYIGTNPDSKIFYLTAKTSGKEAAYVATNILKDDGLILTDIVITAKDKICFCKDKSCNPDECPFARGYYNKIQGVLKYSLVNYSTFDLKTITQIALDNNICPFEFELDLSLFCDLIICDYNYLFDPISHMKRYFDEDASSYLILVDEAHNLIDRSREMYSASICYKGFLNARKSVRHAKNLKLKNALGKLNKQFLTMSSLCNEQEVVVPMIEGEYLRGFKRFTEKIQKLQEDDSSFMNKDLLDFYLDVIRFLKIYEYVNENYLIYYETLQDDFIIHVKCLDASEFLYKVSESVKATTFFSATLSPIEYYIDTLGGVKASDPSVILPSPFKKENLEILVAPKVSVKYKNRNDTYQVVADYIETFIKNKVGNYFIYSPSYEYQENILKYLKLDEYDVFIQEKDMDDLQKQAFLENFNHAPEKTTLGFLVLGGSFSEGIDLVSDRLIGAIIIGIGMPKINFVSNKIMDHYKENELPGYDYAYLYPGMNKVMQAVGRVIRSETDKGAVLLIDERYMHHQFKDLFRREWSNYEVVYTPEELNESLEKFWFE